MRLLIRGIVLGIWLLAIPAAANAQSGSNEAQQDRFQRTFTTSPGATVSIENYKGTIHVTATDSNQVTVDVHKIFDGSSSDRKWWMENLKINFTNSPDRVRVKVEYPTMTCMFCWQNWESAVELEVKVPRQVNVDLDGYKPDIKVSGIHGDLFVKSYKAPMLIEGTTGSIRIDTYKDTLRLRDVSITHDLSVKSYKADLEIDARSLGQSARLENYKGDIILQVPAGAGFDLDFDGGRHSSFHSDFPLNSNTGYSGTRVRATINKGGSHLDLHTERGTVELRKGRVN
ncbi:MAG TPA: hypothetical protein VE783_03915 [Candidatus Limnocylindrales bacterium]|nr:hypothetical protein [Candidatus Limnocylindrales bacterium]